MIKIGILGTGHLGRIHLKLIKEIKDFELVGFYDSSDANAALSMIQWELQLLREGCDQVFLQYSFHQLVSK